MQLHTAYRPNSWDDVVGNQYAVSAVRSALDRGSARSFLFIGEPGLGKTTFARLVARHLGFTDEEMLTNYQEIDGATHTGVDEARAILGKLHLQSIGSRRERVVVLDECHMLSKSAWNSLLKSVEEPPAGTYWVFCTTEGSKVPKAIRSRCQEYDFQPLSDDEIQELLERVLDAEKEDLPDDVFDAVLRAAQGSPRAALVGLGKVLGVSDIDEAQRLLRTVEASESPEVIGLCRQLAKGVDFQTAAGTVLGLQGTITADGIRSVVLSYFSKACTSMQWRRAAAILCAFADPYPPGIGNQLWPVLVSLANLHDE